MLTPCAHFQFEVGDPAGLHLRAAARLADVASGFEAEIRIVHGDQMADGKSVLALLALAASQGAHLVLEANGPDATQACAAILAVVSTWTPPPGPPFEA